MPNGNVSAAADVCNQALAHIGWTRRMTSLADQTPEGVNCTAFYGQARDEVLRATIWPFAVHHLALAPIDPATLENGIVPQQFRFAFPMPAACLRFWGLFRYSNRLAVDASRDTTAVQTGAKPTRWNDNGYRLWHRNPADVEKVRYVRESDANVGQILLSDEREPVAEFLRAPGKTVAGVFTEDVTQWDPDFVRAVALLLASYLAGPLAKDTAKAGQMLQAYKQAIGEAAANAEQEQQQDPQPLPNFIRARNWGRGRW